MTPGDIDLDSLHSAANGIFRKALEASNIESAFDRRIRFEGGKLHRLLALSDAAAEDRPGSPEDSRRDSALSGPSVLDLKDYRGIFLIAMGKAAVPMLNTLLGRMPRRMGVRGICCSGEIPAQRNWRIRYFEGGHPLPSEGSFQAARAALALLKHARKDTLVIFLISGGSSALFDLPLDPGISLEDTMIFHQALISSGAPITEINTVRKHFSAVKGGRLAMAAPDSTKLSILLPDVPLRSLDMLASGPTSPDHSTVEDARAILQKYRLQGKFPPSVREFFSRADLPESPGSKTRRPPLLPRLRWAESQGGAQSKAIPASAAEEKGEDAAFRNCFFEVLLSSHDLVENARQAAEHAGYVTVVDNSCDDWDYADAAQYLLERFHRLRAGHARLCLISGGEVTVTLSRNPGAGGRNQQFALACALELALHPGERLAVLSAGSDGIDGNTRAAGAIADPTTVSRAVAFGFRPAEALAEFNACPLFTALGDSVVTGPTGHNLRDLRLLIAEPGLPE